MKPFFMVTLLLVCFFLILSACAPGVSSASINTATPDPAQIATSTPLPEAIESILPSVFPTKEPTIETGEANCVIRQFAATPVYDGDLLTRFQTEEHFVVLTIDDGYYDDVMNQMLDMLEADGATATFFLLGRPVADNFTVNTMKRLVNDGNDIAYHAFVHPAVEAAKTMTTEEWNSDFYLWREALQSKIGDELFAKAFAPYARVPFGPWTYDYLVFTKNNDLTPIFWTADFHTFEPRRTPLRDGGILILHAVPEDIPVLQTLLEKDWKVVSVRHALEGVCE